jgi:carbamoyl-phosphate synthase small subunit
MIEPERRAGELRLADGSVYRGWLRAAPGPAAGEVVFSTAMGGYPEAITDPSYADQILVLTYPQVGIYGVPPAALEASRPRIRALVVHDLADPPPGVPGLEEYLASHAVPILSGIDTRQLVRHLRSRGTTAGAVLAEGVDGWPEVPVPDARRIDEPFPDAAPKDAAPQLTVVNLGSKRSLVRLLEQAGARVRVVGPRTPAEATWQGADGVVYSNGPGDPADLDDVVEQARRVAERIPTLGICLGHQVLARAFGARTMKLRFGHRGTNHPVKDLDSGAIWITSHNHGYAVADDLPPDLLPTAADLTDGTLEGIRHRFLPVLAVQFHPEGAPGPSEALAPVHRFLHVVQARRVHA